jgi:hypothetical protein
MVGALESAGHPGNRHPFFGNRAVPHMDALLMVVVQAIPFEETLLLLVAQRRAGSAGMADSALFDADSHCFHDICRRKCRIEYSIRI